jgi:exosortase A
MSNTAAAKKEGSGPVALVLSESHKKRWWMHASLAVISVLVSGALFWTTWQDMVSIWLRSETFTHAFLIAPITLWLIYEKREALLSRTPELSWIGMLAVFLGGGIWLLGTLMGAAVIQHLSVVGIVIALVLSFIGWSASWSIAFPLFFLFFMVPMGEDLVPPMMEFTADFTVEMVRLTGIPVYREGLFFMLPTGNWSVVEACSGVRYLIASITLGVLYAYLTYQKWWKRGLFILISIGVPIIANGLRAYMIVMLGHMSDMTVATGVDHLVYGWLFFGVVVFIMIRIGAIFKDEDAPDVLDRTEQNAKSNTVRQGTLIAGVVVALAATAVWPTVYALEQSQEYKVELSPFNPTAWSSEQWQVVDQPDWAWDWQPIADEAVQSSIYFEAPQHKGGLFVDYYPNPARGELINSQNLLVEPGDIEKRVVSIRHSTVVLGDGQTIPVEITRLRVQQADVLVASWYQVGNDPMINTYETKLWEGISRLAMSRKDRARVMFAVAIDPVHEETAEPALKALIKDRYPALESDMKTRAEAVHER